jgi:hypothetical protein
MLTHVLDRLTDEQRDPYALRHHGATELLSVDATACVPRARMGQARVHWFLQAERLGRECDGPALSLVRQGAQGHDQSDPRGRSAVQEISKSATPLRSQSILDGTCLLPDIRRTN